eukprot:COSAG01_NODE_2290_length_7984_cov_10.803424_1_plen_237_part_00
MPSNIHRESPPTRPTPIPAIVHRDSHPPVFHPGFPFAPLELGKVLLHALTGRPRRVVVVAIAGWLRIHHRRPRLGLARLARLVRRGAQQLAAVPARPFPPSIFLGKNRCGMGKSQPVCTDPKMETAGSRVAGADLRPVHLRARPEAGGLRGCGAAATVVRVRVEITGSQQSRTVGRSQPVLGMINPIIFTRTRTHARWRHALATPQTQTAHEDTHTARAPRWRQRWLTRRGGWVPP